MALYRCAACGSNRVVMDIESGGVKYNYKKGAVGTVILGAGGAAAGIESERQQVYKCAACGVSLTYSMPYALKVAIDLGVENLAAKNRLSYQGIPVTWDYLTTTYPNIERGVADAAAEEKQKEESDREAFSDDLIDKMIAYINTPVESEALSWDEEAQKAWEAQYGDLQRKRNAEIRELIQDDYRVKEILKDEAQKELAALQDAQAALSKSISDTNKELSELGFFKRKRKEELRSEIERLKKELANKSGYSAEKKVKERGNRIEEMADTNTRKKCLEVWNRYNIPASPKSQFKVHKFLEPLRIRVGEEPIRRNPFSKDGFGKQEHKAIHSYLKAHPFAVEHGYDSTKPFFSQEKTMESAIWYDIARYKYALICLLVLTVAKQPILVSDITFLCGYFDMTCYTHNVKETAAWYSFENDRSSYDRASNLSINNGFMLLKSLGLADCLCATPFREEDTPALYNNTRIELHSCNKYDTLIFANV